MAGGLGLCGLDPRRSALRGDEIRTCWMAATPVAATPVVAPPAAAVAEPEPVATRGTDPRSGTPLDGPSTKRPRTFVPVEPLDPPATMATGTATAVATTTVVTAAAPATGPGSPPPTTVSGSAPAHGWSLWGELEA